MSAKIVDLLGINKEQNAVLLPIEKEQILKKLEEIPHDVSMEYVDAISLCINDLLILRSIISSSNNPHLVRHLVTDLNDNLLERLEAIVPHLQSNMCEKTIGELVNATWGIASPTLESKTKADELISAIKILNKNHDEKFEEFIDHARILKMFCHLLAMCRMGDEIANRTCDRLSMTKISDLNELLRLLEYAN